MVKFFASCIIPLKKLVIFQWKNAEAIPKKKICSPPLKKNIPDLIGTSGK